MWQRSRFAVIKRRRLKTLREQIEQSLDQPNLQVAEARLQQAWAEHRKASGLPEAGAMGNRAYDPSAPSRMDALADETVLRIWRKLNAGPGYFVFTEDRANPVRWSHGVPAHWLRDTRKHLACFSGTAAPGEFYVFQVAVFSPVRDTGPLDVVFGGLKPAWTWP